jgi:hypothetical protein
MHVLLLRAFNDCPSQMEKNLENILNTQINKNP